MLCAVAFYKEKQARKGGHPSKYIESVKISPAEGKVSPFQRYKLPLLIVLACQKSVFVSLPRFLPWNAQLMYIDPHSLEQSCAHIS